MRLAARIALWPKLSLGLALALLAGCGSLPQKQDPGFEPAVPRPVQPEANNNGAIYQASTARPLFEDTKARHVGDILTVVLTEETDASKSASTSTSKGTSIETGAPTLFGREVTHNGRNVLGAEVDTNQDFEGTGDSTQSNSLSGTLSVTVAEVLPNGNLVVRGEKRVTLNQGEEFVRISGIVRPEDISPANRVPSTAVANARIAYSGRGAVADANAMGWLARFFNSPFWPL